MIQRAKRVPRLAPRAVTERRVAIYTRKSVNEGVHQQFSSLDAQRERVEGYIASQEDDGWLALQERYDDHGYTGANIDRPAFRRLMDDIEAGRVNVVACYRLDRLTRSLIDFAQLMQTFKRHQVAFVSVTERFDTSTPMGTMVLNMLATFAQFEREVIAQRTKDKVSASRRRGQFTGGRPTLGFDIVNKRLVVNPDEAAAVRRVYDLYMQCGGLVATASELRLLGITNKKWTTRSGEVQGGNEFDRNTLASLLKSPLYVGDVRAGDEVVPGEHEAIIERDVWDQVQAMLAAQAPNVGMRPTKRSSALLSGLARCRCGAAMTPVHTKRGPKRYAYYVCAAAVKRGSSTCPKSRVTAGTLESFVIAEVRKFGRNPELIDAALRCEQRERVAERAKLEASITELRTARGRHAGEQQRLLRAVGEEDAPAGLIARVRELDGLAAEADSRIMKLERDAAALSVPSDAQALRDELVRFDGVWNELDPDEKARALSLLVEEVVVDGTTGEAEIRVRGSV
jgi:site-specific DNA recombinase